MKKSTRRGFITLFTVAYITIISLGLACFLNVAVMAGFGDMDNYPRFAVFCLIVGIAALVGLLFVFSLNMEKSKLLGYGKLTWGIQTVISLAVSVPMILLWDLFFRLLQNIF